MTIESEGIPGLYIVLLNNYFDLVVSIITQIRNFVFKRSIGLKAKNKCNENRSKMCRFAGNKVLKQEAGFIGSEALKQRIGFIGSEALKQKVFC
ncbi:hypothetical protein ACSAZK_05370 [Methanosarcina sp. Mfa9]|uniref:hypothetical protein n=1 Tax=Methanosarcina sp. Mfa9 TaxID=3439063 RepID=UPI003F86C6A7